MLFRSLNLLGHIGKREYENFVLDLLLLEKHGPIPLKKYTPSLFNILIGFDREMGISPCRQDDVNEILVEGDACLIAWC